MCGKEGVGGMKESNPAARVSREYGVDYTPSREAGVAGEKSDVASPSFMESAIKNFTQKIGSIVPVADVFLGEVMNPGKGLISKGVTAANNLLGYDPNDPANKAAFDKYSAETEAARDARGGENFNYFGAERINPLRTSRTAKPIMIPESGDSPNFIDLTGKGQNGQQMDLATMLAMRGIRDKGLKSKKLYY